MTSRTHVTGIGGDFADGRVDQSVPLSLFGVIVPLADLLLVPNNQGQQTNSVPFVNVPLAQTTFGVGASVAEIIAAVSVILDPGSYVAVFGTGLFGASPVTGVAYVAWGTTQGPAFHEIFWTPSTSSGNCCLWVDYGSHPGTPGSPIIIVTGDQVTPTPEPAYGPAVVLFFLSVLVGHHLKLRARPANWALVRGPRHSMKVNQAENTRSTIE